MQNYYKSLKKKLLENYTKILSSLEELSEIEKRYFELSKRFTIPSGSKEIDKVLIERIVEQYKEEKNSVIFATLIENIDDSYCVSVNIFDYDYKYYNVLYKKYSNLKDSKLYFEKLKNVIKNNDKNSISLYILENM